MSQVIDGFDMQRTLDFYAHHQDALTKRVDELTSATPRTISVNFANIHFSSLNEQEILAVLSQFPKGCDVRTRLSSVVGKPARWFGKDSATTAPTTTEDRNTAMSPSCIIPSYVGYEKGDGVMNTLMELYALQEDDIPRAIRRIVHLEGLIHEAVHALLTPGFNEIGYSALEPGQLLRFPDGTELSIVQALDIYSGIAKDVPPISRYASAYHQNLNHEDQMTRFVAASEQLCEAVPALFLGYSSNDDKNIAVNPLPAGSRQREFVEAFLNAEYIGRLKDTSS